MKLEASKWKQALKEAEKRVALELNQAKEQGREEREAEMLIEFHGAKESQQLTIDQFSQKELEATQLHQQHLDKIGELELALSSQRQESIQQQLSLEQRLRGEMGRERDQAILTAEADLRAVLSIEWTERMCREIEAALDQAAMLHQNELTKRDEMQRTGMVLPPLPMVLLSTLHHLILILLVPSPSRPPPPPPSSHRLSYIATSHTPSHTHTLSYTSDVEQVRELLQAEISATLAERSQAIGTHHRIDIFFIHSLLVHPIITPSYHFLSSPLSSPPLITPINRNRGYQMAHHRYRAEPTATGGSSPRTRTRPQRKRGRTKGGWKYWGATRWGYRTSARARSPATTTTTTTTTTTRTR